MIMLRQVLLSLTLLVTHFINLTSGQVNLRYDYKQLLNISLLFYEAQRSGVLPQDNRIVWRGDSCVDDRGSHGEDLSGGYYTQGITLKFTFPNAAATTVLAWGALNYQDAYQAAGLTPRMNEAIKWSSDNLVKLHTSPNELYVLIGDVNKETSVFWGRPEDLSLNNRPAQAISTSKPGSEVAAETAAALAASSLVIRERRDVYLSHARELYNFSVRWRGDYHFAVPDVTNYYKSWSGDEDELVWAAIWLYRATREDKYLNDAENMYRNFNLRNKNINEFSWDQKNAGAKLLLYQMTLKQQYKNDAKVFCNLVNDNSYLRTPKGLYNNGNEIGSLRYSSNAAFLCYDLGETLVTQGEVNTNPYISFTIKQIHYALGDTGRSYVVGFGENYPLYPYHSGASCDRVECGWSDFQSTSPNPRILYGALVGGPDSKDQYSDSRHWRQNGVAVDHNSGLQSAVAGLLSLHEQGRLPDIAYNSG